MTIGLFVNGAPLPIRRTELSMARQSVSKHLAVLEAANLVTTQRRGREKLHYLNAEPIRAIADRWIRQYDRAPEQPPHRWVDWHDAVNQP